MSDEFRVLGLIPARGGSKGIPRKNLVDVGGMPLIAHSIIPALRAKRLSRLIVSTDDKEIAAVAREYGAEVPFMRPAELASDDAKTLPVVQHALLAMEKEEGRVYDAVALLQPTTPLRTTEDIDDGIELLLATGSGSVVSVVDVGPHHPYRMVSITEEGKLKRFVDQGFDDMRPRQELPSVYIRSGDLYIVRRHVIMELETLIGDDCQAYIVPNARAVNIDTSFDLEQARKMLSDD